MLGIEGKVDEPFGPFVSEWLTNASANKQARLSVLRETLGLADRGVSILRYQLLHRTAAAIYEAQRYKVRRAVMLMHSFSDSHSWFDDFQRFADAIGAPVSHPNELSADLRPKKCPFDWHGSPIRFRLSSPLIKLAPSDSLVL